ncbi:MAG TPA: hypothetical protein VGZ73_11075 [Bryobacteraceae bacterium]|nr:hypothetical protein [Bryobacteraceae bacterium]
MSPRFRRPRTRNRFRVHVIGSGANRKCDCLLALMNIEFEDQRTDAPKLQLFGPSGLVAEKQLGHYRRWVQHLLMLESGV